MRRSIVVATLLVAVPAVAFAGFRASSYKKETKLGANYWNAASAIDSNLETCWMVDPESENTGEWFEIDLPKGTVDKLAVVIGWNKDEATFKDYARIKTVRVELFGNADDEGAKVLEQTLSFEDKAGWQILDLPDTAIGGEMSGGKLKLTVTEVYPGEDYPNLAVSEVLVHLGEQDVAVGSTKLRTAPGSVAAGHDGEHLVDGDAKTFWAATAAGEQTFEVRAEGFGVSSIGIQPGPATYARPKTIEVKTNDIALQYTLQDKQEVQWFALPAVVGYTGSAWGSVSVRVIDTYAGKTDQSPAVAEVKLRYTNYEGL